MNKNWKIMRISILLIGLLLAAATSAFVVQKALTGICFNDVADGSFWFNVTCWMKAKGISTGYADGTYRPDNNVTRGEMALFIQRAFTNPSMVTYINTGPSAWVVNANSSPTAYVDYYWAWTNLKSSAAGTYLYSMSPSLPSSLYNTEMFIKGVKICVEAGDYPNAYITGVDILHVTYSEFGYSLFKSIESPIDLTATGCYMFTFTIPGDFWGNDQLTVLVWGTFINPGYAVRVGQVTVIVEPSTKPAILGLDDELANPLRFVEPPEDPTSGK